MNKVLVALAVACLVGAAALTVQLMPSRNPIEVVHSPPAAKPNPPPARTGPEVMATCPPGVAAKVVCLDANGRPAGSAGLCAAFCVVGAGGVFTTPVNKEFRCRDVGTAKPADIVPYPDGSYLLKPSIPGQGLTVQCIK